MLKYGIYPPKMVGPQVYYKDIIIFTLEDDIVIGASVYDFDFRAKPLATSDTPYDKRRSFEYENISQVHLGALTKDVTRETWVFNSIYEAFIQKILCLEALREQYKETEIQSREIFNKKISSDIHQVVDNLKDKYPEYFL